MPEKPLKALRLTPAAQADLAAIWTHTEQTWSVAQADAYVAGIRKTLNLLLDNPEIARERDEIVPPVRIHRHRSHLIVYQIAAPFLDVIRVRHAHEDWMANPLGEDDE